MKIALAIASLILVAIVGLFVLKQREPVDHPTDATSEAGLRLVALPDDLPPLFEPAPDTFAADDAAAGFAPVLAAADEHGPLVTGGQPDQRVEASAHVCAALLAAVHGGPFDDGFVDAQIDPGGVFTDPLRRQFRIAATAADARYRWLMEEARFEEADALARAQFELGRRVVTQNVRLRGRQRGLGLMRSGLGQIAATARALHEDGRLTDAELADTLEAVDAWQHAVGVVEAAWKDKLAMIAKVKPNVADLVRVAELDEDRSFRVFATHQLGYARYERGEPGNQRLIADAIARARESDDPLVRAAGVAAGAMTREQFHTSER